MSVVLEKNMELNKAHFILGDVMDDFGFHSLEWHMEIKRCLCFGLLLLLRVIILISVLSELKLNILMILN